jgi:hypothetical protein
MKIDIKDPNLFTYSYKEEGVGIIYLGKKNLFKYYLPWPIDTEELLDAFNFEKIVLVSEDYKEIPVEQAEKRRVYVVLTEKDQKCKKGLFIVKPFI